MSYISSLWKREVGRDSKTFLLKLIFQIHLSPPLLKEEENTFEFSIYNIFRPMFS